MPTGIGHGIAGDVFQNFLGDGSGGGGGGAVCPSNYSFLGDGITQWALIDASNQYILGAADCSFSLWIKTPDRDGVGGTGFGLYANEYIEGFPYWNFKIVGTATGNLSASMDGNSFLSFPELITNGSFTEVPVGAELIANPTFSDAASITPWNISTSRATLSWNARFMRMTYTVANGAALYDNMGQTLNTMYSVKMRVRGVTSAGADQGSAFAYIGDLAALTSADVISNPPLTAQYQDYEFRVWSTNLSFRFYLASAAIGDVIDFDSISVKPLDMLLDNGNFWNLGTDWTAIPNGVGDTVTFGASTNPTDYPYSATFTKTNVATVYLQQDFAVTVGDSHRITYTILTNTYTSGTPNLALSSASAYGTQFLPSTVGTHTVYLEVTNAAAVAALRFYSQGTGGSLEITNIDVEVLGQGWNFNTPPWTIGSTGLTSDGTNSNDMNQNTWLPELGKTYKVVYTIASITQGSYKIKLGGVTTASENAAGTYTYYITATDLSDGGGRLRIQIDNDLAIGVISSISVEEVLSENEWHHLVLSVDRSGVWSWFVDGVITNEIDNWTDYVPPVTATGGAIMGSNLVQYPNGLKGNATEFSLWNTALPAKDVKAIYDNMYGSQICLNDLPFSSDLITDGNFTGSGSELVLNNDFTNGTTDWSADGSSTISVGTYDGRPDVAHINILAAGTGDRITQPFTWTAGQVYRVDVEVYVVSGSFRVDTSNSYAPANFISTSTTGSWQTLTGYAIAIADGPSYLFVRSSLAVSEFYVDSISIKEVANPWTVVDIDATHYVEFPGAGARFVAGALSPVMELTQTGVVAPGKSYTVTCNVNYAAGSGAIRPNVGGTNFAPLVEGPNSVTGVAGGGSDFDFRRDAANVDCVITNVTLTQIAGVDLERWWRMNGSQGPTAAPPAPADYITANKASNGIVNTIVPISSPLLDQDTP